MISKKWLAVVFGLNIRWPRYKSVELAVDCYVTRSEDTSFSYYRSIVSSQILSSEPTMNSLGIVVLERFWYGAMSCGTLHLELLGRAYLNLCYSLKVLEVRLACGGVDLCIVVEPRVNEYFSQHNFTTVYNKVYNNITITTTRIKLPHSLTHSLSGCCVVEVVWRKEGSECRVCVCGTACDVIFVAELRAGCWV